MSLFGSAPISCASNSRPSARVTRMRSARATTCSLVSTCRCASISTPEPRLCSALRHARLEEVLEEAVEERVARERAERIRRSGARCSVVTFTTAGPLRSTTRTVVVRRRNGSPSACERRREARASRARDRARPSASHCTGEPTCDAAFGASADLGARRGRARLDQQELQLVAAARLDAGSGASGRRPRSRCGTPRGSPRRPPRSARSRRPCAGPPRSRASRSPRT